MSTRPRFVTVMLTSAALAVGASCTSKHEPSSQPEPKPVPETKGTAEVAKPAEPSPINAAAMRETVAFLATKEMKGRRVGTPENRRAAEWIARRFEDIGLKPAVQGSYFHEFPFGEVKGRNVVGVVEAPNAVEEFVIVGAHYDGVGDIGGRHRPAAGDNASGVAALLVIAEAVFAERASLQRNVVFASYDAEEQGLIGSTKLVNDEVIPSEDTKFALIFDMVGGTFFPWQSKRVAAMGDEHSAYVRGLLRELTVGRPVAVSPLGTYVLEPAGPMLARSDYRAYRSARVPYLFFSSGTPWYYHMPGDGIDKIDFQSAAETAQIGCDIILRIARGDDEIDFKRRPKPEVRDLVLMASMVGEILEHRSAIALPAGKFEQLAKIKASMEVSIGKEKANSRLAHRALMLIFESAQRSRPKKPAK